MKYRNLGNTGLSVSEVSVGTWAIGGNWGSSRYEDGLKGLQLAKAFKGQRNKIHIYE